MPDLSDLIGIPFERMNCAQVVIEVFRRFGIELPKYEFDDIAVEAAMAPFREKEIKKAIGSGWYMIKDPESAVPSLVLIKGRSGYYDHLGVYIGQGRFLHADRRMGILNSSIKDLKWKQRVAGYYEFTG